MIIIVCKFALIVLACMIFPYLLLAYGVGLFSFLFDLYKQGEYLSYRQKLSLFWFFILSPITAPILLIMWYYDEEFNK